MHATAVSPGRLSVLDKFSILPTFRAIAMEGYAGLQPHTQIVREERNVSKTKEMHGEGGPREESGRRLAHEEEERGQGLHETPLRRGRVSARVSPGRA